MLLIVEFQEFHFEKATCACGDRSGASTQRLECVKKLFVRECFHLQERRKARDTRKPSVRSRGNEKGIREWVSLG